MNQKPQQDCTINNIEIQKNIINMLKNRVGDIKYFYNPEDGIPSYLEPYSDVFIFEENKFVKQGKGYFIDTGKFSFKLEKGFELI